MAQSKSTPPRGGGKSSSSDGGMRVSSVVERVRDSVTLPADVIRATLDDAVKRGHLTRDSAEEIVTRLLGAGAAQTQALLADIEQIVGRTRGELGSAASAAKDRAKRSGDPVRRHVDKARRAVGVASFPISGYEDLTASQVNARLDDLTPAQLRKVRDHERRNANRKSVLGAIEKALA